MPLAQHRRASHRSKAVNLNENLRSLRRAFNSPLNTRRPMSTRSLMSFHGCRHTFLCILALHLFATAAPGITVPLDRKHSSLTFMGEATLHKFRGEAKDFTGKAEFNENAVPPIQKATLHFQTAALTTFHQKRDQKMREWLNVNLHPKAIFQLQRVKLLSGNHKTASSSRPAKFSVSGVFTLNGVTRRLAGTALAWREGNRFIVTGQATVNTLNYGLPKIKEALVMTVSTDVKISYRFSFVIGS